MKNIYLYLASVLLGMTPSFLPAMESKKRKFSANEIASLLSISVVDSIVNQGPSSLSQSAEFQACVTILNSGVPKYLKQQAFGLFEDKQLKEYFNERLNSLFQDELPENYATYKYTGKYAVMKALLDLNIQDKARPDLVFSLFFNLNGQPIHRAPTYWTYLLHQAINHLDIEEVKCLIETHGNDIIAGSGHGSTTLPCAKSRKYYLEKNGSVYELESINQIIEIIKAHGGHSARYDKALKCLVLE